MGSVRKGSEMSDRTPKHGLNYVVYCGAHHQIPLHELSQELEELPHQDNEANDKDQHWPSDFDDTKQNVTQWVSISS